MPPRSGWGESFDHVIAVNVRGVFLGLKHVMPVMQANGGGSIVNTASTAALTGTPTGSAYVASKHAVLGLTRVAALEGAPHGIRVNAICPGGLEGRMMSSILQQIADIQGVDPTTTQTAVLASVPLGRLARPEEIADTVSYLLSSGAAFMTGAAVPVDGGVTAQ
jgi:NAD(P)-dependent dehydrogenase (short-subunit alcohol dehydrogenase family)